MISEKDFLIQFAGLKQGEHQFEYHIENDFFDMYQYHEFNSANIQVQINLLKKTTMLELSFSHKGTVNVPCDVTNEDFDLPIEGSFHLVVKFGEEFNNENEELLILPHGEYQLNVAQFIYETIALSVPYKRIHPDIAADYKTDEDELDDLDFLDQDDLEMINEDDFLEDDDTNENKTDENSDNNNDTDPRWDKLKQLLTDK